MKFFVLIIVFSITTIYSKTITIAVSSNVGHVIEPLKEAFYKLNPESKINIVLGSSGKLTAQILQGAPYDVFMSADMVYPQTVFQAHKAITKPIVYIKGNLIYFSTEKRDFSIGLNILLNTEIKKIAIANPKTAPYGKAALDVLQKIGFLDTVKSKLVYGQSVSDTLSFVHNGADIGFVAKSSMYSPQMKIYKENFHFKEVDQNLYQDINQGIVLLTSSKNKPLAREFYNFILSENAKIIFKKYGYTIP